MAKEKATAFFCKECGYESAKWYGMCPSCHAYNSMVEAPKAPKTASGAPHTGARPIPRRLEEIASEEGDRIGTGSEELDRVLGGGILPGSLILTGGDPGIGKSTLLLQVFRNLARAGHKVLYISGEESLRQLKLRADRIGAFAGKLKILPALFQDIRCRKVRGEIFLHTGKQDGNRVVRIGDGLVDRLIEKINRQDILAL